MKRYPLAPAVRAADLGNTVVLADADGNIITPPLGLEGMMLVTEASAPGGAAWQCKTSRKNFCIECDFTGGLAPWTGGSIGVGGALLDTLGILNHPGVQIFECGNAGNSGYYVMTNTAFKISGSEETECILKSPTTWDADETGAFGWVDTPTVITAPTDGIWLGWADVAGDMTVYGKTAKTGGATSTTASGFIFADDTYYLLGIVTNNDASRVDFYIFDMAGKLLWTDLLTTNIPTTNPMAHGIKAWDTTGGAAHDILIVDYINLQIHRALQRG